MMYELEACRGLTGYWHFTTGEWKDSGHLETACRQGVSTHFRRIDLSMVDYPRCKAVLKGLQSEAKIRTVDEEHGVVWFAHACPRCGDSNVTPLSKQKRRQYDWCWYICEVCKHQFGPVVYSKTIRRKVAKRTVSG